MSTAKGLLGCFALALVSSTNFAFAQSSVQFEIGESSRVLEASLDLQRGDITQAQFNAIQMTETCKSPSARLQDRNRPWMLVWNTSAADDAIESVTVDLTQAGFELGDGDVTGDGFDGLLSMLSNRSDAGVSLSSAVYGGDNTEVVLSFSGLSKGVAAVFRIDIDQPGGISMFPDFREAMMGGDVGYGAGTPAKMTTEFASDATVLSSFGLAGVLTGAGVSEAYHAQGMSPVVPSTTVPEPTSLVMLLTSLAAATWVRRKR